MKCRYCNEEISSNEELAYTSAYWCPKGDIYPCHISCKIKGKQQEAYDCQCIDADCNDCYFFNRELNNKWICYGTCKNPSSKEHNKKVEAYPNFCSNHECFVHRKDGSSSQ